MVVAGHCVRKDGLAASAAHAVTRSLDDLASDDAGFRDVLRPMLVSLVKKAMTENAEIRLQELTGQGVL